MRMRQWVLGLLCGLAATAAAWADCHDPKHGTSRPCQKPFDTYVSAWTGESARVVDLEGVFLQEAQLTGSSYADGRQAIIEHFKKDLKQFGESARYEAPRYPSGGHLKVGGFLFFGGTELKRTAHLRWKAKITPKGQNAPTVEDDVVAVLVETGQEPRPKQEPPDPEPVWRIVSLHIERTVLRR